MAYLATLRVGLWTVPRTGYTRVIGNCNGSGRWRLSDSLKQRERENSPCAPAVLLYIHPGNKVKSESNPEVGVEPVGVVFPYDHLLLP